MQFAQRVFDCKRSKGDTKFSSSPWYSRWYSGYSRWYSGTHSTPSRRQYRCINEIIIGHAANAICVSKQHQFRQKEIYVGDSERYPCSGDSFCQTVRWTRFQQLV